MGFLDSEGLAYFFREKIKPGLGGSGGGGVPKGSIIIWSGTASDIPDGWALCDGQDGRPDLRDRFVLGGGGTHTVGETGGEETHKLTVAEMPSHNHSFGMGVVAGTRQISCKGTNDSGSGTTGYAGNNQPHNNMPPYYALCYIIKVTDGGSGGGSGSAEEVYSTEETRIGTWIDGKPFYRKSLYKESLGILTASRAVYNIVPLTVEELKKVEIMATVGDQRLVVPYIDNDGACFLTCQHWGGNLQFIARWTSNKNLGSADVTMYYTKTTD